MNFIFLLLINAGVILLVSKLLPSVIIKDYKTAITVALVIGLLNATIGFLLRLPLNIVSLFLLTFIVRVLVTALMIKLADLFLKSFEVKTFTAALVLAVAMAIAGALFERAVKKDEMRKENTNTQMNKY